MELTANTADEVNKLYQTYLSLNHFDQTLLKLLAVLYRPIRLTKLNKLLKSAANAHGVRNLAWLKSLKPEHQTQLADGAFIVHETEGIALNILLSNRLSEDAIAEGSYATLLRVIEDCLPSRTIYDWQREPRDKHGIAREYYFLNDFKKLEEALVIDKNPQKINIEFNRLLIPLCFMPFQLERFLALPDGIQYHSLATWIAVRRSQGTGNLYPHTLLEQVCKRNPGNSDLTYLLAESYLMQLRFDEVKRVLSPDDNSCYGLQLNASLWFLTGEFEQSRRAFEQALTAKNRYARRKNQYLGGTLGLFYKVCLLVLAGRENAAHYSTVLKHIDAEIRNNDLDAEIPQTCLPLYALTDSLSTGEMYQFNAVRHQLLLSSAPFSYYQSLLVALLGEAWCNGTTGSHVERAAECRDFFSGLELTLFAEISAQLCSPTLDTKSKTPPKLIHFPTLISPKAQWDIALERLIALSPNANNEAPGAAVDKPTRMIWEMYLRPSHASFKAREQKRTANNWSKGRTVALKRLFSDAATFSYLTDADLNMCQAIEAYQDWSYYSTTEYVLSGAKALVAAQHLDNVFLAEDLTGPIELIQKQPELLIRQQGDQLLLSIADLPPYFQTTDSQNCYSIKQEAPERFTFKIFNDAHLRVADIIGEGGLMIPAYAKAKALASVAAIAPLLNIQSDIDELDTGLETVPCDEYLTINIQPLTAGLEFTCLIMPFGERGPALKPTQGNANLTAELDGKRVATQRDLMRESVLLDKLDEHCPQFLAMGDNTLALDDLQTALDTLEQLERVVNQTPMPFALRLRWPKGKKVSLTKRLEAQHLQLAIGKRSEWFDLTGELKVDDQQVIELQKLLELVATSNGRFVQLDAGQILALSDDLRHKLEQLNQVTDGGKFHLLASLPVGEATTGMRMKTIHAWDQQTKKMHEANAIAPTVPSTLQANLRDYQQAGFDWMSRLAHWGAGACLADDMGLGKTLQALAILVARANEGPSLVIAPTSVCFNWQQEAAKFAPTLNIKLFSDSTGTPGRSDLLSDLSPFDCVILSYGLLQRESELLATVQWHTIVADEAQALKNPLAKRTQAAYALKGDFKIITTGTPIENNLTELWSLFRFINPGLLGNIKRFGQRYALPIENTKDDKLAARKASQGLKTLIQPFILRRMKNQVLTELPSRTEINLQIELSAKEQAFYEALRLNAIKNITASTKASNAGEQRIKMLAELVKLRQACCNPKLVMAESDLPSAKLQALDELLDELQQNNHKALIFSQFVGHLQLIKQHLDGREIRYQYLDGSTPQKDRAKRVTAFQNGEGEVFLISLKAGGSGLNLTAADYVIHMDPWWNPAVEDQASDRAHRMGQQRPVTIYRLIAKHTIEEKIVALHQHKRDLADKLLAGNEQVSKLSVEDMLNMLKETF